MTLIDETLKFKGKEYQNGLKGKKIKIYVV